MTNHTFHLAEARSTLTLAVWAGGVTLAVAIVSLLAGGSIRTILMIGGATTAMLLVTMLHHLIKVVFSRPKIMVVLFTFLFAMQFVAALKQGIAIDF